MRSISRVAVIVPSIRAGLECFERQLGFSVLENVPVDPSNPKSKRWVTVSPVRPSAGAGGGRGCGGAEPARRGGSTLVLREATSDAERAMCGNQGVGKVFLFLETDDFAAEHSALGAAGVEFLEEPRSEPYAMVVQFRDALGNKWDLLGPPQRSQGTPAEQARPPAPAGTLHYFRCRGRAAAIRLLLAHLNVPYVERTAPFQQDSSADDGGSSAAPAGAATGLATVGEDIAWPRDATDPRIGGTFSTIPTWVPAAEESVHLQAHGSDAGSAGGPAAAPTMVVSQAQVIMRHLARTAAGTGTADVFCAGTAAFADAPLSAQARDDMAATAGELDLLNPLSDILWAPKRAPGCDVAAMAPVFISRTRRALAGLERLAAAGTATFMHGVPGAPPGCGDFVVCEAVFRLEMVFGAGFVSAAAGFPALERHSAAMRALPRISQVLDGMPGAKRLGGSPFEKEIIAHLRKAAATGDNN
jgi:hypothetical protein